MITLSINGKAHDLDVDPDMPLLWVIREAVGLPGTKYGCGKALCGACTVHVDGLPVRSCSIPVASVGARDVTTIEGLESETGKAVQASWLDLQVPPMAVGAAVANALHFVTGNRYRSLPIRRAG